MLVGDKVRIKDEYINSLGRKGEVMTVTQTYTLGGNLMCDVGNGIAYREDKLEIVETSEFEKAKAKHEELLAEREKAPKQETNFEKHIVKITECLCVSGIFDYVTTVNSELKNWLLSTDEELPKIKMTQFEYDFLTTIDNQRFNDNARNMKMKKKGYFKGIDTSMMIREILKRAVIVDEK